MGNDLIFQELEDLKKASVLLKASIKKFKPYKEGKIYTPAELEYYDSLSFRFEKGIELTLSFFKGLELFAYAKVSDTLRDRLLVMQKLNIIDSIDFWIESRLLGNRIAHTYMPAKLKDLYDEIYKRAKTIFKTIKGIENYLKKTQK